MKSIFTSLFIFSIISLQGQDTFSIVAVDPETGEVGSAGASCVDLSSFGGLSDGFLGELFPAKGAINTQAWYNQTNQANARNRMNAGDTPDEIIDWLINNDVSNQPQLRQYGIVAVINGEPASAAHTGSSTDDYKNHITGPNYAIQGNILLGQEILDSMESKFLNEKGDLACKLMAALQGANVVGADTRCAPQGTSSLFAFVKVAQPNDVFGNPSFAQSVRTSNGDGIEPIDSLQTLFDEVHECSTVSTNEIQSIQSQFSIYPNPVDQMLTVESKGEESYLVEVIHMTGLLVHSTSIKEKVQIDASLFSSGLYFIRFSNKDQTYISRLVKK